MLFNVCVFFCFFFWGEFSHCDLQKNLEFFGIFLKSKNSKNKLLKKLDKFAQKTKKILII
jgi:hypothetical protein